MIRIAMPLSASDFRILWMSCLEPMSTPTVGPFRTSTSSSQASHFASTTALLVAAGERLAGVVRVGRGDGKPLHPFFDLGLALRPVDHARAAGQPVDLADEDVVRDRAGRNSPSESRSSGT